LQFQDAGLNFSKTIGGHQFGGRDVAQSDDIVVIVERVVLRRIRQQFEDDRLN